MPHCEIIDTFPAFLAYWTKARNKPVDAQVETWAADYMSQWPELLKKQLDDYASQDEDWRQIARERVFPFLNDRLPAMKAAHKNLLEVCAPVYSTAQEVPRFESDVIFVIQWRDLSPRANIERHFAWMKRYFGLKYFRVQGYFAMVQFVFRVYIAALAVAFIAVRHQRPELATLRLKVLAFVNT